MDDEPTNEPHEAGADDEGTGAMAQCEEQDERSDDMGVADETPAHDAERAQRREVEAPVDCVMCVGDGDGETGQGHEGTHDAESRGDKKKKKQRRRAAGAASHVQRQAAARRDRSEHARQLSPALPSGV